MDFFEDEDDATEVVRRESIRESKFLAWMKANADYSLTKTLTYAEFPQRFIWKQNLQAYEPQKQGFAIGHVACIPLGMGEAYYLRILLKIVKGPTSYEEIRTVNGMVYDNYCDTCYAMGLLDDDKEYIDGFSEVSHWASASQLGVLFVTLLTNESMVRPKYVWDNCIAFMYDDILHRQRRLLDHSDLGVEHMNTNILIFDKLQYDRTKLAKDHDLFLIQLNTQQRTAYETIIEAVDSNNGEVFFLYGYRGTGKTFVWKTLSAALRPKGEIVLYVASSGIASLLLPGGRTTHSRFVIPLTTNETSTCNTKQDSHLAQLIIHSKLIIWDEAPMKHMYCYEALDRSLRDIMRVINPNNAKRPFGRKMIVFCADFCQILLVIPKGGRQDILNAAISSSYIWEYCIVLPLTENMHLKSQTSLEHYESLIEFEDWIASVGDGTIGELNDGSTEILIPDDMLVKHYGDPILSIVHETYPNFIRIANDPKYLQERAIHTPTLDIMDAINDYMTSLNVSEKSKTYLSLDRICKSNSNFDVLSDLHSPEFLNSIRASGVPNH